jgi:hypothetical protein
VIWLAGHTYISAVSRSIRGRISPKTLTLIEEEGPQ